jgi:Na+/phosphate symporter
MHPLRRVALAREDWTAQPSDHTADVHDLIAQLLAGLMLVIGGAVWEFTRHEEGAKKIGQAIFGIAIMFGAVQIVGALAFAGATV